MSVTNIPDKVKIRLWVKAAGRCQYEGCNQALWKDEVTMAAMNAAYIAHIVADSPDGPRGDSTLSDRLKSDISNLMLLCDKHHRLIDVEDVCGHPVDRLTSMKSLHESRVERVTSIDPSKTSHILMYGANIGDFSSPLVYDSCADALQPHRYPASDTPISISLVNSTFRDNRTAFWEIESEQIRTVISQQLKPRLRSGEIRHLSVFALAPQPLLVLLGAELSELIDCEVFQRRKEPASWKWDERPPHPQFEIVEPNCDSSATPALVFSISGTVTDDRIYAVLSDSAAIWKVSVSPADNDLIRSPQQIADFKRMVRPMLDRIKARHGENATIHVFPAMPASLAVELGRIVNRKADLPLIIYDQQPDQLGFVRALQIGHTHS